MINQLINWINNWLSNDFVFRSETAKRLKDDCYTLILGFNAFLATVMSTLLSMLLVYSGMSIPKEVRSCYYCWIIRIHFIPLQFNYYQKTSSFTIRFSMIILSANSCVTLCYILFWWYLKFKKSVVKESQRAF